MNKKAKRPGSASFPGGTPGVANPAYTPGVNRPLTPPPPAGGGQKPGPKVGSKHPRRQGGIGK